MARLCDLAEQVLAEKQEMHLQLRNIDYAVTSQAGSIEPEGRRDTTSWSFGRYSGGLQLSYLGSAFIEDLLGSRVYPKLLL